MLDKVARRIINKPLGFIAGVLKNRGITKDMVTVSGFGSGILAILFLYFHLYMIALFLIAVNRVSDGLDGAIAQITSPDDSGGFLDITLDFIFYSGIVFGFALADPDNNAIAACFLLFSFMGAGSSFLSFSVMAEKNSINNLNYPNKSLYYLDGLMEGTETIIFFTLFCLFPDYFPWIASLFAIFCWITTGLRIYTGYKTLKII